MTMAAKTASIAIRYPRFFQNMVHHMSFVLLLLLFPSVVFGFVHFGNNHALPPALIYRATKDASDISASVLEDKNILVVGGSGRVGGSVVTQLVGKKSKVTVGGTNVENFERSKARWNDMFDNAAQDVNFVSLNKEDASSLSLENFDLVVHTAGPFQGKVEVPNGVLEACVAHQVPYIDVCDDYCTATAAKTKFHAEAQSTGVPCVISTGCWPGVSSLMAKQVIGKVLQSRPSLKPEDLSVDFSFFTAGSGGAGATLLVATFLILAEKALTVVDGRRRPVQAMKEYSSISFGDRVGIKDVAHLNLLETASIHDILGVGNVKSLFGTAPDFWNALLGIMAQLPSSLLANEELMSKLAVFSLPIVRVVDYFAGAINAMRCDVSGPDGIRGTALYAHDNLEPCVGECVVAFCAAVMSGKVPAGVWFPEEAIDGGADAAAVLKMASVGAHTVQVESSGDLQLDCEEIWGRAERV